jgi:peptidoglycan DL-endopeptidase CwlO
MHKSLLTVLLAAALMNGCSGRSIKESEPHDLPQNEVMVPTDNRMNDPAILQKDQELRLGDIGVEDGRFLAMQSQSLLEVSPNPAIAPVYGNYANNVISFASLFLGTPYEYGSDRDNPSTFDCSDFTRYAYLGGLGMDLPKDSRSQASYVGTFGKRQYQDLSQAKPGDLLFFTDYNGPRAEDYRYQSRSDIRISHVGIYLGNGNILHTASKATGGVRIDYMYGKHLEWRFVSGGSVLP